MALEDGLFGYLSTYSGLSALVATRIYPEVLPQAPTYPAITYTRVATSSYHSFGGGLADHENVLMQFSCFSRNNDPNRGGVNAYSETVQMAEQLRKALQGFKGIMGTTQVDSVTWEASTDVYDDEAQVFHRAVDFRFLAALATS